jgi:tetratricopeptide (TPR) repeat protein
MYFKIRQICVLSLLLYSFLVGVNTTVYAKESSLELAQDQYNNENYEEALSLLKEAWESITSAVPGRSGAIGAQILFEETSTQEKNEIERALGLTYYHLANYDDAQKYLSAIVEAFPDDENVRIALGEIALASGKPEVTLDQLSVLKKTIAYQPRVRYLEGRTYIALGEDGKAIDIFRNIVQQNDPISQKVVMDLVQAHVRKGDFDKAQNELQNAIENFPDAFEAREWRVVLGQLRQVKKPFTARVGYRLAHDSNVPLEPESVQVALPVSGKSDIRHALLADVLQQYAFTTNWSLYQEGHLYHSIQQKLKDYNQTKLSYVVSPAWSEKRYGFRVPLEIKWNLLNGNNYQSAFSFTPGAYYHFPHDVIIYGFGRLQKSFFDENVSKDEDRSGNYIAPGIFSLWYFNEHRGELRAMVESGSVDTKGSNWDRKQTDLYLHARYEFIPRLTGGFGYLYQKLDFDNLHTVYKQKRSDKAGSLFLSAAYQINGQLDVQGQLSRVKWDSNFDVYTYSRTVVSVGINWQF